MTECSSCGDCCDPVYITRAAWERMGARARLPVEPDQRGDPEAASMYEAVFARNYWRIVEDHGTVLGMACEKFDTDTRRCTAYEERPPICAHYPYYGRDELGPKTAHALPPRCSFNADVRTSLPILEVKTS